jgi:ubiquinone biosynthesis O-methyltransferase
MTLAFTGEYFIPGEAPKRLEEDHTERYRFAAEFVRGKTVLDIACGVGYGSKYLANAGALRVDGVDITEDVIDYAKLNYQVDRISFTIGNIYDFKSDISYDVITCFETIEHVKDYRIALSNLYSLLNKNGVLLISTPNRLITSPRAKSLNDKPSNKYHVQEFILDEFKMELQNHNFRIDKDGIFGQRQQRYFRNKYCRMAYNKFFKTKERASPAVTPVQKLMPRYFLIVARKLDRCPVP